MKQSKLMNLFVAVMVLSGCGRKMQTDNQLSLKSLNLRNFTHESYLKKDLQFSNEPFQLLGVFEKSDLPTSIQNLPTGTRVGTLSLIGDQVKYEPEYQGIAKPEVGKVTQNTKWSVHLIEHQGQMALGIKRDQGAVEALSSKDITVKSEFVSYESKIDILDFKFTNQLHELEKKIVSFSRLKLDTARCNANRICRVSAVVKCSLVPCEEFVTVIEVPIGGNELYEMISDTAETNFGPSKIESKQNTFKPTSAMVRLSKEYSKDWGELRFDL